MTFVAGHFGEWLQGLVGVDRTLALVTMSCPVAGVTARVTPAKDLDTRQDRAVLSAEQIERFLRNLGAGRAFRVNLTIDLPPGGGAGMSTAALVALARAAGADESKVAAACLAAEGATDPLMLDAPESVLWAPREARALGSLPRPPGADIVGGFWGAPTPTDPADLDFPIIDDLVGHWRAGVDMDQAAALARESARRTTALRGPTDDPTEDLMRATGALGMARAHTGSARALIFRVGQAPAGVEAALSEAGFTSVLRFQTGGS